MRLKKLSLINFKNLPQAEIELAEGINCFVGDNGAGKTNILDAIYYLSMSKSAFTMTDGQSVNHDGDFFVVEGAYRTDGGAVDVSMVALLVSGLYRFSLTELVGTLLFAFCSASFLMVLKEILSSLRSFGAFIPALIIVISCICPVFFNFKMLRGFSFLFPPTYYINMVGSSIYLLYMCGYSTACLLIAYIIRRIKKHRNAISRCDAKLFS